MSYENTSCPCGEKKLTDTMLCAACETAVGGSYDRKAMDDHRQPFELRRQSALRVLSISRRRRTAPALPLAYQAA
jgi:hypothetical protein